MIRPAARWLPAGLALLAAGLGALTPAPSDAATAAGRPPWLPRRALWVEASANLQTLSSREAIRDLVARARAAGFDTLVPEAKNAWGFVLYESAFAPPIRSSPVARPFPPVYPPPREWFPPEFDPLGVLIEEAHAAGMRVHAAVNIFGEGLVRDAVGPAFERPEWQSVHLVGDAETGGGRLVPAASTPGTIAFANPAHPEAALYELAVLWEIVSRYPVDGLILDRARYADVSADFSDISRRQFETALGRAVANWPEDIQRVGEDGALQPGPLFAAWVAWRASVIKSFVRAAAAVVHQVRPGIPLAMYVGAWYPAAFETGQNWGRVDAPPSFGPWSPAWANATLLPHVDYVMIGLYYPAVTPLEAMQRGRPAWRSVVGGALLAREVTRGVPVVGGIWLQLFAGDRARGGEAMDAAARLSDGLMVFDLSDVVQGEWWQTLTPP